MHRSRGLQLLLLLPAVVSGFQRATALPRRSQFLLYDGNPLQGTPFETLYSLTKARESCPPQVCVESLLVNVVRQLHLSDFVLHWVLQSIPRQLTATKCTVSHLNVGAPDPHDSAHMCARRIRCLSRQPDSHYSPELRPLRGDKAKIQECKGRTSCPHVGSSVYDVHRGSEWTGCAVVNALSFVITCVGSLLVQGKPILESFHAATALAVILLFGLQGLISLGIPTSTRFRDVHSTFGWLVVAGIAIHFTSGLFFGFSS